MLSATEFRKVISGERQDLTAKLWRATFGVAAVPYRVGVGWRNRQFDRGSRAIERVGAPVVSVGNLTVGGTGKTPMVEWLARWFRNRGVRVCLVSRGYGAESGSRNDEALELEQKLPDVPHLQNPDRVAAAQTAIEEFESELILLDDAFQHRRIHRDLDIVLIDALEPFGYGRLLPRGLLREPISSLSRADVVVLSRSDAVDQQRRTAIHAEAERHAPEATWLEVSHQPIGLLASTGESADIDSLRGKRVAAFCGIGNPAGFRHSLEQCGFEVASFREFPDHHAYTPNEIARLAAEASKVDAMLCTHKDLVKVAVRAIDGTPVWALQVGLAIDDGIESFERQLEAVLASR